MNKIPSPFFTPIKNLNNIYEELLEGGLTQLKVLCNLSGYNFDEVLSNVQIYAFTSPYYYLHFVYAAQDQILAGHDPFDLDGIY